MEGKAEDFRSEGRDGQELSGVRGLRWVEFSEFTLWEGAGTQKSETLKEHTLWKAPRGRRSERQLSQRILNSEWQPERSTLGCQNSRPWKRRKTRTHREDQHAQQSSHKKTQRGHHPKVQEKGLRRKPNLRIPWLDTQPPELTWL